MTVDTTFVSSADLSTVQTAVAASLPATVDITRLARSSDGMGGHTQTWNVVEASVPARLMTQMTTGAGAEIGIESTIVSEISWIVTLPVGTDVRVTDRLVSQGLTLEVNAPLTPISYQVCVRVLCTQLTT